MKIGIIGTGNVGGTLGTQLAKAGHAVIFGEREASSPRIAELLTVAPESRRAPLSELAGEADVLILATPWEPVQSVLATVGNLAGKVLIDAVNPIMLGGAEELGRGLLVGHTTSAAEQIASWAPSARVVKAFNTIGAQNMANPVFAGQSATMFICGDDSEAKQTVAQLASDLGFAPEDVGTLKMARLLEPVAMLWIHLAVGQGWGPDFAFKVVRR